MAIPGAYFRNVAGTPSNPQFARITLKGHCVETDGTTRPSWNVFDFRKRASGTPGDASHLASAYMGQIGGALAAALSDKYVPDGMECKFLDDPAFLPISIVNTATGTVTGDRMPSGNGCVTIRLITNAGGRNFRGSKHFSPIAESQTLLDELTSSAVSLWTNVAVALLASPITDSDLNAWDLLVLSADLSDLTTSPSTFTGAYVVTDPLNTRIGTMRRRRQRASRIT